MKNEFIKSTQVVYAYKNGKIISHPLTRIGRKYFYVKGEYNREIPVSFEDLRYEDKNYSQCNMQFYSSEQEILDLNERREILRVLSNEFGSNYYHEKKNLTLEQLRRINAIINE